MCIYYKNKMPRGRPLTVNVKEIGKKYFTDYYHATNEDVQCECGCLVKSHSKRRHMLSKKHIQLTNYIQSKAIPLAVGGGSICSET
jgi:hypothetical protein